MILEFKTNVTFCEVADEILSTSMSQVINDGAETCLKMQLTQIRRLFLKNGDIDMYECDFFGLMNQIRKDFNIKAREHAEFLQEELTDQIFDTLVSIVYQTTLRLTVEKERERLMAYLEEK